VFFLCSISLTFYSCGKKGCSDKFALNYESGVTKDDGTCTYDADIMVGNWNVAASIDDGSNSNFTANITKEDNTHINILWGSTLKYTLKVNINNKTLSGGISPYFNATFNTVNDFLIYDYAYVTGGTPHFGNYHYTR